VSEGGSFRLLGLGEKIGYIVKSKPRRFGFNQNPKLYNYKNLKIKNTYRSYRLTDKKLLTD
jgi:hypothetical protein